MNRNAKDAQRLCLLDAMIIKEKLTSDEIITTVLDLLIIGVTSVSNMSKFRHLVLKTPKINFSIKFIFYKKKVLV